MPRSRKLFLDLLMGAGIPALILAFLSQPLGAPPAYVLAAMVPVAWVLLDLFAISRHFNAITSVVGMLAVGNGALAFWFVDGLQYAFKDSLSMVLYALLLLGSAAIGRPFLRQLLAQSLGGDSAERRRLLGRLFDDPAVRRTIFFSTLAAGLAMLVAAGANFTLNVQIVTAPFGTDAFNLQVAQVNALTRAILPLWTMLAFGVALYWPMRTLTHTGGLPKDASIGSEEFWAALEARQPVAWRGPPNVRQR